MGRIHLFEIEDQTWCPRVIRDGLTDFLQHAAVSANYYGRALPLLNKAIQASDTRQVIDLCSGGGGPWLRLQSQLESQENLSVEVLLTDRYPNQEAFDRVRKESKDKIRFHSDHVDARNVPAELKGYRTLFCSFHHFRPGQAKAILADAVDKRQGIAVFEVVRRSPLALLLALFIPLVVWLTTPFVRPFRWSRLLLTYVIPILPFCALFDGTVSCLRAYSLRELKTLIEDLPQEGYKWEMGTVSAMPSSPIPVTYLIGHPS